MSEARQRKGGQQGGQQQQREGGADVQQQQTTRQTDQAHELLHQGEVLAKDAYNKFCDTCGQLKGSPRLMTALLLLSAFALGIGIAALAGRMGYMGWVPSQSGLHKDKAYWDAHSALDTVLMARQRAGDFPGHMKDNLYNAREKLIDVMAAKAKDWSIDALKAGAAAKMAGWGDSAGDLKERIAHKYHEMKGDVEPTFGERIVDGLHDARDSLNDAYYKAKGKVMGKKEEVKEHPIKSQLHKAENKMKDVLHKAADAMHLG